MKKVTLNILLICHLLTIQYNSIANLSNINWVNYGPNFGNKKFYAIEFWATWCVPCITSFPKLEEYQKKYPEISFVALSKENKRVIKKFLEKRKINLPIGQDLSSYWHNKFRIMYYPTLVLLDVSCNVIFKGHPSRLNNEFLDSLLTDHKIDLTQPEGKNEVSVTKDFTNDTTFTLVLNKSYKNYKAMYFIPDENGVSFVFTNHKIKDIIIELLNIQKNSLSFEIEDTSNYDFSGFLNNYKINDAKKVILDFLCSFFHIKIETVNTRVKGYKIVIKDKIKLQGFRVEPSEYDNIQHSSTNDSLCSTANFGLKSLAELIGNLFNIDVVYLGKDDNRYNFEFPIDFTLARKVLNEQYGLFLESALIKKKLYIAIKK